MQRTALPNFFILLLLALIYIAPLLSFTPFVTQDGPMHVYGAKVIQIIAATPEGEENRITEFFDYRERLHTNIFIQHFLAGLMHFLDPVQSEKVLQILYVLLFIFGAAYALRELASNNLFLIFLFLPFIYNYLFFMGFYNFVLGIAFLLFALTLLLRWFKEKKLSLVSFLLLALLGLLIFACHMTSFVVLVGVAIVGVGYRLIEIMFAPGRGVSVRANGALLVFVVSGVSMGAYLIYTFLMEYGDLGRAYFEPKGELLRNLLRIESLVSLDLSTERILAEYLLMLYGLIFLSCVLKRVLKRDWFQHTDLLLVSALGILVSYFFLPLYGIGSGMITTRVMLYPFLLLFLWFAVAKYNRVEKVVVASLAAGLSLAMLYVQMAQYQKATSVLEEFLSTESVLQPGDIVYPVIVDGNGYLDGGFLGIKVGLFLNITNYLTSMVPNVVNICNAAANEKFSPIKWDERTDRRGVLMQMPGQIPDMGFGVIDRQLGDRLNVILVWGADKGNVFHRNARQVVEQIPESFEHAWTSPGGRQVMFRKSRG